MDNRKPVIFDRKVFKVNKNFCKIFKEHHRLARHIATESAVLLKNDDVLPLKATDTKIAFIGAFAKEPRYQGGGSSHINAFKVSSALDAVEGMDHIHFAQGFVTDVDETREDLLNEAIELAKSSEVAVIFAGLPDSSESEFYDRTHMKLPNCQNELIKQVAAVQPNTVVVLHNGSPVEMPWVDEVPAILEMYLGGQAVGEATVDLLFGVVNPSGKLAETFPIRLEDNPSYLSYKVVDNKIYYDEKYLLVIAIMIQRKYQFYFHLVTDANYTTFEYSHLVVNQDHIRDDESLIVSVDITNTGKVFGKEVVQLYVQDLTETAIRPVKELRQFEKVALQPGETQTISFTLTKRDFAYYHTEFQTGMYQQDNIVF